MSGSEPAAAPGVGRAGGADFAEEVGLGRVLDPKGTLPQAAERLDPSPRVGPTEARVRVELLNLDAVSFRQFQAAYGGNGRRIREAVLSIVAARGKLQNPVTGSGGMLIGTVEEVGIRCRLPVRVGERVASLMSLTATPLHLDDGLAGWDGRHEQVPAGGHAILFSRSPVAAVPGDLPLAVALAAYDVCGAPALTARLTAEARRDRPGPPAVVVVGASGKAGALSVAAARRAGAAPVVAVVPDHREAGFLEGWGGADEVVVVDGRDVGAMAAALGERADVTVVCVDVAGCEAGAVAVTAPGGVVAFFSMATSFPAATLIAESLGSDVVLLMGNGYVPGHAALAVDLLRGDPGLCSLLVARTARDR